MPNNRFNKLKPKELAPKLTSPSLSNKITSWIKNLSFLMYPVHHAKFLAIWTCAKPVFHTLKISSSWVSSVIIVGLIPLIPKPMGKSHKMLVSSPLRLKEMMTWRGIFSRYLYFKFQSETCGVNLPDLELELDYGTLGGVFTTVEGLLEKISDHLGSNNPFVDSDPEFAAKISHIL